MRQVFAVILSFPIIAALAGIGPVALATPVETGEGAAVEPAPDLTAANDLVREQRYAEAETLLAELQVDHPDDAGLLLMRGELLLALGRPADALAVLAHAVELDPDRPRLQFQYGTALASGGEAAAAIDAFGRAAVAESVDSRVRILALLNRAALLQQVRRWPEAAEALEAVLAEAPEEHAGAFGDLAAVYLQAGRPERAAEALERGTLAGFRSAHHFYSVGARFFNDGEYAPAVRMLNQAISADPTHAASERSLAAALERLGRDEEAADHLQRYLELKPDAPDAEAVREQLAQPRAD